ncbi:hypothetical protein ACHAXA_009910 [Cyclostephanos tholiformis]|uniref:Formamidopyrimidine-DNA glycosylase catalytic domain-containing protein n=1 Tax=Cyclostephanos tholiformis TaxID=382380 RepID=A0ABD3R7Y6_9STRA
MPELPEVEHYRRILLPLVGGGPIALHCPPPLPTKRFPSRHVVDLINVGKYDIKKVLRKGKVLCIILTRDVIEKLDDDGPVVERSGDDDDDAIMTISGKEPTIYLSLHMGMTGRISSPDRGVPKLESLSGDESYPPSHTHLILRATKNGTEAAFSDPRRFGSVLVDAPGKGKGMEEENDDDDGQDEHLWEEDRIPTFRDIAPDALEASGSARRRRFIEVGGTMTEISTIVEGLMNRKKGIKGLLLDQRAVVSGVGNWVADELLYRCRIHPDQTYLNMTEACALVDELHHILSMAVTCLDANVDFPDDWLFHRRWRNGFGGNLMAKDVHGRSIKFIQSGGRSSAIVPSIQKKLARSSAHRAKKEKGTIRKVNLKDADQNQKVTPTTSSSASNKLGKKRKVNEEGATLKPTQPTRMSRRLRISH